MRFIVLFWLILFPVAVQAEELIRDYHSKITVREDGSLIVTETIKVIAEGREIKRGIYRDFPLMRTTFLGGKLPSHFSILSVKRDGVDEPWHSETKTEENYYRVYIGRSDVYLNSGVYTYDITYSIPKQIFFFDKYDELNWNAIGTGWVFPIEQASAEIILPQGAEVTNFSAYTGKALSTAQNFTAQKQGNRLLITTTQPLKAYEGLTVAVAFPKSFVTPSPDMLGMDFFWKQHEGLQMMLAALIVLSFYYYSVWSKYGRDPRSRGLAPFYDAPEGISPAMAAYIHSMGDCSSQLCMTSALVSLGSKGYLTITEEGRKRYTIARVHDRPDRSPMSEDEQVLSGGIGESISIHSGSENLILVSSQLSAKLRELCLGQYFNNNTKWWLLGLVMFLASVGTLVARHENPEALGMGLVFASAFGGISCGVMCIGIKKLLTAPLSQKFGAIFMIIWSAGFSIGGFLGLWLLSNQISWLVVAVIMVMLAIVVVMRYTLKAPTRLGREVMDHLKGLQYYMSAVEEKVLQKFDPPQMSRELYEKYLPYAVALGVESKWADKFAISVAGAMVATAAAGVATAPYWYHGLSSGHGVFSPAGLVSNLGNAISAASTSNSSSSSGGGSSGGGGGGGGGGGW